MVPKKRKVKLHCTVLRLSDLDHSKAAVLSALTSPESQIPLRQQHSQST